MIFLFKVGVNFKNFVIVVGLSGFVKSLIFCMNVKFFLYERLKCFVAFNRCCLKYLVFV